MFRIIISTVLLSGAFSFEKAFLFKTDVGNLRTRGLLQMANLEVAKMDTLERDMQRRYAETLEMANSERYAETIKVFPVPAASRCIVIMVCQYMVIYTALAVCRTYHEFSETAKGSVEAGLKAASQTLTYAPMICVLFIACRMHVEFLSAGKDQPQIWVQNCMYALTFAVMTTTLLVLFLPCVTGKPLPLKEGTCDLEQPQRSGGHTIIMLWTLTTVRYLILLFLYGGLAGVILGINIYLPPGARHIDKLPSPAPAIECTMILAIYFFTIQLVIALCRTYAEFTGVEFPKVVGVMNNAANTVEFAPMLSIVFLAARMRAVQHDGQPQRWAQVCMYASTYAMCTTTILTMCVPLALEGSIKTNEKAKEATLEAGFHRRVGIILIALRFACMLSFYGGVIGVIYSILVFEAPAGANATLPVSPTVQCVINLTSQFFFIYAVLTICSTVQELSGGRFPLETYKFYSAVDASKATIAFAPMLAVLFVTTRMYALLITEKKGAPQAWVQDGMYMATWSLLLSFLACLTTAFVMDEVALDEDGNVVNKFSNRSVAVAMIVFRYFTMLLLYGGIATVIVGLFVMTPETANGRGSVPVLSDVVNSTPLGKAPPGPSDVVG